MAFITVALRVWFAVVLSVAQFLSRPTDFLTPEIATSRMAPALAPTSINAQALRISQIFGGGSATAPYPCDFIELYNASDQPVSLSGWSVQYAAATVDVWKFVNLAPASIGGHRYLLVAGSCSAVPTTQYDVKGTFTISSSDYKVALVTKERSITGLGDPAVVDFVGYGGANEYEGSRPAPKLSSTTAGHRAEGGCVDTDDNAADFTAGTVGPHNSLSPAHACPEAAPAIWSTSPKRGATNVARDALLTVDFSEPVSFGDDWFEIRCDLGGARGPADAVVSGGPAAYTIDPAADLLADDACRLTIFGNAVHDSDEDDPPDAMPADYVVDFRTVAGQCGDPAYKVHDIQGPGADSPAAGQLRTVEGVVTADFQGSDALSGYFLQEEAGDADDDVHTSEGLFVDEQTGSPGDVAVGDRVRVTGTVSENDGMTVLGNASRLLACPTTEAPQPLDLVLPLASPAGWEQYEGMLVRFGEPLTVADSAELATGGRLTLVAGDVPLHYTQQNFPDAAGHSEWEHAVALRTVVLDDGSLRENPDPIRYPAPGLSAANTLRAGDTVAAPLTGVMDGRSGAYAVQPAGEVSFVNLNPRVPPPARASGNVRAAFLSLGDYFNVASGTGGPRGAATPEEFVRQRDKLVSALVSLDADIIAVSKLENDGFGPGGALADLVDALNAASGPQTYAFVDPGLPAWGAGVVTVGVLYRTSVVLPIGAPAMLSSGAFDQASSLPLHCAPMAQVFEETTWGERFTLVVNEWHDRASCPSSGPDADAGDGQDCWNAARTAAAADLQEWLSLDPANSGDPDVLVLGELHALSREDPIQQLATTGYADLVERYAGSTAFTTLASGQAGYLDHALASSTAATQVAGTAIWGINAEEPAALDYRLAGKSASQQTSLYAPDPYRSSDHSPLVVDLELLPDQGDLGGNYGTAWHTGQGVWRLGEEWGADDGAARGAGSWNDGRGELTVNVTGPAETYACLYGWLDFGDGTVTPGVAGSPDGDWNANENVLAGVPLAPGPDQPVTFALPTGAIGPENLNMRIRLVPAPDPQAPACELAALSPAAAPGPTGRADGGEVEDYTFEAGPLATAVSSFSARREGKRVLLSWATTSEEELAGFDLYRGPAHDGPWQPVNLARIPAHAPGAGTGTAYRHDDEQASEGSVWYRLDAFDFAGGRTLLGLAETRPGSPTALALVEFRAGQAGEWRLALLGAGLASIWWLCRKRQRSSLQPPQEG